MVDVCNGVDDDGDMLTDEDSWVLASGNVRVVTLRGTPTRVAVAADSTGFVVALSAACTADLAPDIFLNHVDMDETQAVLTHACTGDVLEAVRVEQTGPMTSTLPQLVSNTTDVALGWTEETAIGAQMRVSAVGFSNDMLEWTPPVAVADVDAVFYQEPLLAYTSAAPGAAGIWLAGFTHDEGNGDERAYVRALQRGAGTLTPQGGETEVHTSTEGEVALAAVPGGTFAGAWPDATFVYGRWFDSGGAVNGIAASVDRIDAFPYEALSAAQDPNTVWLGWREGQGGRPDHVRLGRMTRGSATITLSAAVLQGPERGGHFGMASGGNGEVVVAMVGVSGALQVVGVDAGGGQACSTLTVSSSMPDIKHVALAIKGNRALLVWRSGPDVGLSAVRYVMLKRLGQP